MKDKLTEYGRLATMLTAFTCGADRYAYLCWPDGSHAGLCWPDGRMLTTMLTATLVSVARTVANRLRIRSGALDPPYPRVYRPEKRRP